MSYRVAVAVSGRGSNLLALCDAQLDTAEVVLVLSDRDAPALDLARARGIATHRLISHQDPDEWTAALAKHRVDLLVLAGYLKLIPARVVAAYRGRVINIHPALLPRHGGPGMYGERVHRAVLSSGDQETGATVHLADEEYDRGAILGQVRVPVLATDSWEQVAARVLTAEHRLLPAAVVAAARAGHPVPFDLPPAA